MRPILVDTTNFPLYAVNVISENEFIVAGGGGASKTGVPNAIAFYRVSKEGKKLKATKIFQYEAKNQAIMNVDVNIVEKTFAAGMDNMCRLFKYTIEDKKKKDGVETSCVVKEIASQTTASGGDSDDAEYQKCVRFSADGNFVTTGSSDGQIKILKYPSMTVVRSINAHAGEIDDLDFHPNSKKFVSVCRDGSAFLWNTESGVKDIQLHFSAEHEDESLFRFRNCRFSYNVDDKQTHLYTTHVQAKFTKNAPKLPCYIVSWDVKKFLPKKSVALHNQSITQLAVSPNGRYVGVGTANGSVFLYIAWNLKLLHKVPELHNIFVTGLAFLPESKEINEELKQDVALLSVSVDNTCHLTTVAKRHEFSFSFLLFVFACVICLMFVIISHYDIDF